MELVSIPRADDETEDESTHPLVGLPLTVVFAEGDAIDSVKQRGTGAIRLEPPFHVSDEDAYLVVPDDIGMELVDIVADADFDLLAEALRDSLLVIGTIEKEDGGVALVADEVLEPQATLDALPYAATVPVGTGEDPVEAVNRLPHAQITVVSRLLDDDTFEKMVRKPVFLGRSWSLPFGEGAPGVDPTYAWSRRTGEGRVGIELALFQEYEELVVLLRPVELVAA